MRKVWTYKRKDRPGVYVHWYDGQNKQHSKRLPDQRAANAYKVRLAYELNVDLYAEPIIIPWADLTSQYLREKTTVQRASEGTLISIRSLFSNVARICNEPDSMDFDHDLIRQYVAARNLEGASPATVNKDLRTIHAFVNWAVENGYMGNAARSIRWKRLRQREPARAVKSLTVPEFIRLLRAAEHLYGQSWRVRLLLALATGLRLRDIEKLCVEQLDFDNHCLQTHSQKTGKAMSQRPIHPSVLQEVRHYLAARTSGRILMDRYHHTKWQRIRRAADLPGVTYQQLRKTFGSLLAQAGFSTAVVQDLLEHSTPTLTQQIYLDVSPQHRQAVQVIPFDEIIDAADNGES